jgi:hypothetical protein
MIQTKPKKHATINRARRTRKSFLLVFFLAALGLLHPACHVSSCLGAESGLADASARKTFRVYRTLPCLTRAQLDYGRDIIRGLEYNDQRIFRRFCRMDGFDFSLSKKTWQALLATTLSYEQVLAFEQWSELKEVTPQLAIQALSEIEQLSYEASRAFRAYLELDDISPRHALRTIPLLNGLKSVNKRAVQGLLTIQDMDGIKALDGIIAIGRLVDHQARAADSYARIHDMNSETMFDTLPILRQLRQEDAWNAHHLFRQKEMTRIDAWLWIIRYFALPPLVQEAQYYRQDAEHKKALLKAFYDGGEELIWKINNLHAITDRFGFEISEDELKRQSRKQLYNRFKKLSRQTRYLYGKKFYPAMSAGNKARMIAVLRAATAADRVQVARELSSANIYALLSQGSELYDSSFRDILVPILKKRMDENHHGDLLAFMRAIDPDNMLVSSFIVSLAQKGKLTTFFPEDDLRQKKILDLVASSAFASEDSILLFSATFVHLLKVLQPDARTYLIEKMSQEADRDSTTFSRLISVILQYYMQEYPELLTSRDQVIITRLIIRRGAIDLSRYQQTPFAEWKSDGRLASISIFHPDDDGRKSFLSNSRTLLKGGYRMDLCDQYTLVPLSAAQRHSYQQLVQNAWKHPGEGLVRLFAAMRANHFAVAFTRNVAGIRIRHCQYVYGNEKDQQLLLERYFKGGDEMIAQRGHSYWRSEQLTEPLVKLLREQKITDADIDAKQRFLSLGSCGGVKAYTRMTRLFRGHVDILATIGTGMAIINDPYNKNFLEVIARNPDTISWKEVADKLDFIFRGGRGQDYLQPGCLTAILHKIIDEDRESEDMEEDFDCMIESTFCPEEE